MPLLDDVRAQRDQYAVYLENSRQENGRLIAENIRLRAEVERLHERMEYAVCIKCMSTHPQITSKCGSPFHVATSREDSP